VIRELAPAKVNLVLRVGPVARNGLHEICSLFASLDLHDVVEVRESDRDTVICENVEGPNLAEAAIAELRRTRDVPALEVRIEKRIPVAAGLGGGSADAAAALRAANRLIGSPLDLDELEAIAASLGSDVPSQVQPCNAVVSGTGAEWAPIALPPLALVLVPASEGLLTAEVYREADRLEIPKQLGPELCTDLRLRDWPDANAVAEALENDLQQAALSLRPELGETLERVRKAGALGALVSGSGPTVFGVFAERADADRAAAGIPGGLVTMVATE
jgi:4-diphosphocytidyl-2-C-methyl-D-erythritol kinase